MDESTTAPVTAEGAQQVAEVGNQHPDSGQGKRGVSAGQSADRNAVTVEGLRGRVAAALHGTYPADWHGAPADECTTCQTRARVIVAALAGDPGDLPARMAAEMRAHGSTVLSGECLCGARVDDWDEHLAAAAMSVRWEDNAATLAENAELRRRAEHAEGELSALRDHRARWQTEHERAERLRAELTEARAYYANLRKAFDDTLATLTATATERDARKAAIEQLRYERRLLGWSRMTLDLVAAGDPSRWEQARREAEDIAQRIVDEIGHPVTDEPALGPGYRAAIERTREAMERYAAAGCTTVNLRQVINLLSPTWPDGNYEAAALDAPETTTERTDLITAYATHLRIAGERADAAEAAIERSRAALATFDGRGVNNFDIPTPGEVRDAWRASLAALDAPETPGSMTSKLEVMPAAEIPKKPSVKAINVPDRIDYDSDGELDDIVVNDCTAHLERMNTGRWYLGLYGGDGRILQIDIASKTGRAEVTGFVKYSEGIPAAPETPGDAETEDSDG